MEKLIAESKHTIDVSCVLSEGSFEIMCDEFGFDWVYEENIPVGNKINTGIKHTLKYDYDYLMMMNSDDVVKAELLDKYYEPFFESLNPYFGVDKVTYVNWETKEAREFQYDYSVLGIGKMIRRDVVEMFKGNLYDDRLSKGLDDHMMDRMISAKIFPTFVKYEGMLAMDFKSEVNIWSWEKFKDKGKIVCYKQTSDAVN